MVFWVSSAGGADLLLGGYTVVARTLNIGCCIGCKFLHAKLMCKNGNHMIGSYTGEGWNMDDFRLVNSPG